MLLPHQPHSSRCYFCRTLYWDVKLILTGAHVSLTVAFKGPNEILELYKCNYSLTRGKELGAATG